MNWGDYAQALLALIFVLTLIGLLTLFARKFGYGSPVPTLGHKNKRVHIVEVTQLDAKRRLVLVRRDEVEHLIMLGHDHQCIIEASIQPNQMMLDEELLSVPTNTPTIKDGLNGEPHK